jgi:hypothetical protein
MGDVELLAQLRSTDATMALQIIDQVFQALDQYSKDVSAYRKAKGLLLEALDDLARE